MKPHPQSSKTANLSEPGSTQHGRASGMRSASSLLLLVLFLALAPTALASSTWYVDGVNGSDNNDCTSPQAACKTIGHAISLASSGDSIMVAAATYTENLSIGFSLKVIGSGAATTIIEGGGVNTVVTISSATAHVSLSKLTIQNGSARLGGGIANGGTLAISDSTISGNHASSYGGGVHSSGMLAINNSTITGNRVVGGCKKCGAVGGGISNVGTLIINNSTISGNSTAGLLGGAGGGIFNKGKLSIKNSTINANDGGCCGGGIDNFGKLSISNSTVGLNQSVQGGGILNAGTLTTNNSTISGNSAANGWGGGIFNDYKTVSLQNTIVANSPSGGNCSGPMASNGYNLSSDNTCNFNNTGDLNNTDPVLGPLQNNGGPTQTQALLSGSPAIDAGNPSGCTDGQGHLLKTDQRGAPRPDHEDTGGCDMGAYERQKD